MSNGGSEGPSKGNEYAIEALKQVLTLAGAILALTITFLKDALGDARSDVQLQFLVPTSWFFLTLVIWTAWITLATAARAIGTTTTGTVPYVFKKGSTPRFWALVAQFSFALGLTALAVFAIANFSLYFRPQPAKSADKNVGSPPGTDGAALLFDYVGRVGPFVPGNDSRLERGAERPEAVVDGLKRRRQAGEIAQVLLIGSADKFDLEGGLAAQYGSNEGLARARAEWVKTQVLAGLSPAPPSLSLTVGPREHGARLSSSDTAPDRSVAVYLVWKKPG